MDGQRPVTKKRKRGKRMKKKLISMLLICAMSVSLAACGSKEEAPAKEAEAVETQAEESETAADDSNKYAGRTLKVLQSVGGAGNYYEAVAERMMELYPGLNVEVDYNAAAGDTLRTQILAGEAPDIFCVNSGELPIFEAIEQGIAMPVNEVLEVATMDGDKTLGDIIDIGMLTLAEQDGNYYALPETLYISGLWYDVNFFEENGLKVPESWEDCLALAEELDAMGVDLFGYTGVMASEYATNYWFWPMVASNDYEMYSDIMNLEADAFKSASMQKVLDKMQDMRDNGYYNTNTMGLGNAETQMSFIDHDFAFLPCGSWLEAEMADAWTEDWELGFLPYAFGTDAGDTNYLRTSGQCSMISSTTENFDLVCEFYRVMYSDHDALYNATLVHQNPIGVEGFGETYGELLLSSLASASTAMDSMGAVTIPATNWYPTINTELGNMINAFMSGDIEAEEFMQRGYDLIDGIKNDDSITKHTFGG